jgi:hypothetical protein
MECNVTPRAMTVIQYITKRVGVTVGHHPESYLLQGIHTDSGCNKEHIAVNKQSYFNFGRMNINEQISNNIGHCLLYRSKFGTARRTTGIR